MLDEKLSFSGTAGVCRPACGAGEFAGRLIGAGLEHHVSFAYGDHRQLMRAIAARLGIPLVDLEA